VAAETGGRFDLRPEDALSTPEAETKHQTYRGVLLAAALLFFLADAAVRRLAPSGG